MLKLNAEKYSVKFIIGDKVRVVKDTLEGEMEGYTGLFTRYEHHDDSLLNYYVELDGGGESWFREEELELINE
ncbi:MAG: hypothetical protein LBE28_03525 [Providencia alcalifaciens]|jgi:hypothetical protein|nr:hypothetical protein [Providencia alcalifaciens]